MSDCVVTFQPGVVVQVVFLDLYWLGGEALFVLLELHSLVEDIRLYPSHALGLFFRTPTAVWQLLGLIFSLHLGLFACLFVHGFDCL